MEKTLNDVLVLISQLAQKLGTTTESLWPHVVRYTVMSALLHVVVASFLCVVSSIGFLIYWKKNLKAGFPEEADYLLPLLVFGVVTAASFLCTVDSLVTKVPIIIEPVGATVKMLFQNLQK